MSPRILLIDNDTELLTLLQMGLESEDMSVSAATSGKEGIQKAYQIRPDLIVLDIMMPEMDGWTTLQHLREISEAPVIVLTAATSKKDVIKGLSLEVDDYLTKPCTFTKLKARIQMALGRRGRSSASTKPLVYDDGHLRVDLRDETVTRRGELVDLSPTESRLLAHLLRQRGEFIPSQELLVKVWGPEYADEASYLRLYIRYLRQKIEQDPANPRYIRTLWERGYYFGGNETLAQGLSAPAMVPAL
jgi:two-component system KDP operon response regulator KdpE